MKHLFIPGPLSQFLACKIRSYFAFQFLSKSKDTSAYATEDLFATLNISTVSISLVSQRTSYW